VHTFIIITTSTLEISRFLNILNCVNKSDRSILKTGKPETLFFRQLF
jgi:hypothetical protein